LTRASLVEWLCSLLVRWLLAVTTVEVVAARRPEAAPYIHKVYRHVKRGEIRLGAATGLSGVTGSRPREDQILPEPCCIGTLELEGEHKAEPARHGVALDEAHRTPSEVVPTSCSYAACGLLHPATVKWPTLYQCRPMLLLFHQIKTVACIKASQAPPRKLTPKMEQLNSPQDRFQDPGTEKRRCHSKKTIQHHIRRRQKSEPHSP
ncbi:hypothetical protein AAGG40_06145, partial [Stenotrophomonas maltophilia]